MAYEAQAVVTNEAKRRIAEMWCYGTSYQVKYFAVSAGGHDPADPTTALAVDPAATVIPGAPPSFGPEAIDAYEWESDICPIFVCTIQQGELIGIVSSVGLYAEIVADPIPRPAGAPPAPAIGYQFLYAVYNRPMLIITATDGPTTFKLTPFM